MSEMDPESAACVEPSAREPITIGTNGQDFIGKCVLVGIRYYSKGETVREEQFLSLIFEADEEGIVVERPGTGRRIVLPPEIAPARKGRYRLHSTGEIVVDPDYLATWAWDLDQSPGPPECPPQCG